MQTVIYLLGGLIVLYLLFTLICTYFVQELPRNPVSDPPDWGRVFDTKIAAIDGGLLEVWRIEPQGSSKGLIVFAHGWGRNRDRMVSRARIFARFCFGPMILFWMNLFYVIKLANNAIKSKVSFKFIQVSG